MVDLTAPLTELVAALEASDVSARELLDLHLDRIERLDGPINSVVTLEPERARAEASAIDEARAAGCDVGAARGRPDHREGCDRHRRHPLDRRGDGTA